VEVFAIEGRATPIIDMPAASRNRRRSDEQMPQAAGLS
jgi:hypothetical protein